MHITSMLLKNTPKISTATETSFFLTTLISSPAGFQRESGSFLTLGWRGLESGSSSMSQTSFRPTNRSGKWVFVRTSRNFPFLLELAHFSSVGHARGLVLVYRAERQTGEF